MGDTCIREWARVTEKICGMRLKKFMNCMYTLLFSFLRACWPVTGINLKKFCDLFMLVVSSGAWASYGVCNDGSINFNRDVRPI